MIVKHRGPRPEALSDNKDEQWRQVTFDFIAEGFDVRDARTNELLQRFRFAVCDQQQFAELAWLDWGLK